jgi:hypothetical protein
MEYILTVAFFLLIAAFVAGNSKCASKPYRFKETVYIKLLKHGNHDVYHVVDVDNPSYYFKGYFYVNIRGEWFKQEHLNGEGFKIDGIPYEVSYSHNNPRYEGEVFYKPVGFVYKHVDVFENDAEYKDYEPSKRV